MKEVKIIAPEGYEIDGKLSTPETVRFKKVEPKNIMERVKSFEDACKIKGVCPEDELPYPCPKNKKQKAMNSEAKRWLIAEVLCEGWEADYDNSNQYKYYPYFKKVRGSGFVYSYTLYDYGFANTTVGSRLCFPTRALAEHFGKLKEVLEYHNS